MEQLAQMANGRLFFKRLKETMTQAVYFLPEIFPTSNLYHCCNFRRLMLPHISICAELSLLEAMSCGCAVVGSNTDRYKKIENGKMATG